MDALRNARTYRLSYLDDAQGPRQTFIVVARDEAGAREVFSVTAREQRAGVVERVDVLSRAYPTFSDGGSFARIDHRSINFPVPALALPLSDCGGAEGARRMGFEPLEGRDPVEPLPQAESLTVRVPNSRELALYIRDPDQPLHAVDRPSLEIEFPDEHPGPWLTGLWETGRMALLASPRFIVQYETLGAWLVASWVLMVTVPEYGHEPGLR